MTATVLAADGRPIILSPTGVAVLRQAAADHHRSAWTDPADVHPATREKLLHAGLLRWVDPDHAEATEPACAAIDLCLAITDAGMDAARKLAGP